jgi:hypothetical protein
MLTGRRAFEGASQASLIAAIMSAQPTAVSSPQPGISPPLDRVVRRCLSKSPDDRWQTARDLAEELRWIQQGVGVAPPVLAPGRRSFGWMAAAAIAAAAAVAFGMAWLRQEKPALPRPLQFGDSARGCHAGTGCRAADFAGRRIDYFYGNSRRADSVLPAQSREREHPADPRNGKLAGRSRRLVL